MPLDDLEESVVLATILAPSRARPSVLCIGAHCDDIEIGMGGALLAMARGKLRPRVHWLILTSDPVRKGEAERAMRSFVPVGIRGTCTVGDLQDGYLPAHFREVKDSIRSARDSVDPDIVFTHCRQDLHQDHRLVGEITWQTFRNQPIFEYEIPKYEGDLLTPNVYVPVSKSVAERKIRMLMKLYGSQRAKYWFSEETFRALLRLRGVEARAASGYAEGFHCAKLIIEFGGKS